MHHAKVYMAARNSEKARAAIEDLKRETGKEAVFLILDLSDLESVKRSAEEFLKCANFIFVATCWLTVSVVRSESYMFSSTTRS